MPLKTTVKVSHITNLSDARYCAGMGVEMLGFRVIPGLDYYMPPPVFQEIRGWIAGPAIVCELYGLPSIDLMEEVTKTYAPDYLELSFREYKELGKLLNLPCIVYFPHPEALDKVTQDSRIACAIVDEDRSCDDVAQLPFPVWTKISTPDHIEDKLRTGCYKGVVLEGPRETRHGITSYDQLGRLLEALEED